jgi:hypothetical protein
LEDLENAVTDTSRSRHVVSPTLARSLREAEASSFAESGIWPETDSDYMAIKTRLLAGEITVDETTNHAPTAILVSIRFSRRAKLARLISASLPLARIMDT